MASADPDGAEGGPALNQGGERRAEGGTEMDLGGEEGAEGGGTMDLGGEGGEGGADGGAWSKAGGQGGRRRKRSEEENNGSEGERNKKVPRQGEDRESQGENGGRQGGAQTQGAQGSRGSTQQPRGRYDDHLVVYAKGKTRNLTKINPNEMLREIEKAAGEVTTITRAGDSLRIVCTSERQKQRLTATTKLGQYEVDYSEPYMLSRGGARGAADGRYIVKGIILGVQMDTTEEEILEASEAITAKRIQRRVKGQMMDTAQVVLTYYDYLPDRIKIGWDSYRVREFIPDPMRCMKCQQFAGHKAANCRAAQKCPICAGPHAFERCPQSAPDREAERQPRCPNCSGAHSAAYRGCPAYKQAKEIVNIKFAEKISYADAVRQYHHKAAERRQQDAAEAGQQQQNPVHRRGALWTAEPAIPQPAPTQPATLPSQTQNQPALNPQTQSDQQTQSRAQPRTAPTTAEPAIPQPAPTQPSTLLSQTQNQPALNPAQPQIAPGTPHPMAPTQPAMTTGAMPPPAAPRPNPPAPAARARRSSAIHQGLPVILTTPRCADIQATPKNNKTKELEEMMAKITTIFNDNTETRSELERLMFTLITKMYNTLATSQLVN